MLHTSAFNWCHWYWLRTLLFPIITRSYEFPCVAKYNLILMSVWKYKNILHSCSKQSFDLKTSVVLDYGINVSVALPSRNIAATTCNSKVPAPAKYLSIILLLMVVKSFKGKAWIERLKSAARAVITVSLSYR